MMASAVDALYGSVDERPHFVTGLRHTARLGHHAAIVYKSLDQTGIDTTVERVVARVGSEAGDSRVDELIDSLMRHLRACSCGIMAHVAGYDATGEPVVYEIMGESLWRVNVDDDDRVFWNFAILERHHFVGRLIRPCTMLNGGVEERLGGVDLHAELQTIDKAVDTCRMLVNTGTWLEAPLDLGGSAMPAPQYAVVTPAAIQFFNQDILL